MINSILLHNFQSHKNSKLEFNKGLNIIQGGTGVGKTSILRALRWALQNKPSNIDNIHLETVADTKVTVSVNGRLVERIKTKSKNIYKLDEEEFKAFGTDVPEDISKVVNINDVNVQRQHNKHFLLSETSGNVAKFFNKIAHLDKIDTSTSFIKSKLSKAKSKFESLKEDRKKLQKELKELNYVDELDTQITLLEQLELDQKVLIDKINKVKNALEKIKETKTELENTKIKDTVLINSLLLLFKKKRKKIKEISTLNAKIEQIRLYGSEITSKEKTIKLEPFVVNYFLLAKKRSELTEKMKNLKESIDKYISAKLKYISSKKDVKSLEMKLEDEFSGVCPVCKGTGKI